jgi:hypothetical protein
MNKKEDASVNAIFKSLVDMLGKMADENDKHLDELQKAQLTFSHLNGKYYVGDRELPSDLREWGEIMISEMAKKLLDDKR